MIAALITATSSAALADGTLTAAPPPDAKELVSAPTAVANVPVIATPTDSTSATVSAGGQLSTGNSRLAAATANGKFDMRRGSDGFGASLLGNYGQGALPGQEIVETTANLQGRVRYDRYVIEQMSLFGIATGRYDKFQGLDFRLNLDPGVKYLFVNSGPTALWGELGYDFQYDIRNDSALVQTDAMGMPLPSLDKTATDHSGRAFVGFTHAFNKEVTFSTGIEYLQSLVDSTRYRLNYDGVFAANIGAGLALGVGISARYDHAPLPGKQDLDTATTLSLIYAFSAPPPAATP
ncbi:MAG: DUF481 domain-containing protein [Polyangiaceae bacterium]